MKDYVIHKTEITSEDNFLFFSGVISIILAIKTEMYFALAPFIILISIGLLLKIILLFKWQLSYAIKLTSEYIILNHTILYNKITIPLSSISCLNREKRYIELDEDCNIIVFGFGKRKRIQLSSLSDNERKAIFDYMEDFGIVNV